MLRTEFESYALDLLAILDPLPMPVAVALDPRAERVEGNRAFRALVGIEAGQNASVLHPEGRAWHQFYAGDGSPVDVDELPLRRACLTGETIVDQAMELERADGRRFQLVVHAWPMRDAAGSVAGAVAVFTDDTPAQQAQRAAAQSARALQESERRYRLITEAMPQFVWLDGPDGSAAFANARWLEYTGLTDEENRGWGWQRVVHPDDAQRLDAERERTLRTGQDFEGECRYRGKDGKYRWFLFRSIAIRDDDNRITGWLGTATDIDKQKRAEQQQSFFAVASDLLGSSLDVDGVLERIASLAISALGTWCEIDLPDPDGALRAAAAAHQDPGKQALLSALLGRCVYAPGAAYGPQAVYESGRPELVDRVKEGIVERIVASEADRDVYRRVGYYGGIIVPLRVQERILGTVMIATDDPSRLYTEFDLATACELGRRGAVALENAQSYAREHRLSKMLQRALLPAALPEDGEVRFHAAYTAAGSEDGEAVGGDWYDAFRVDDRTIAFSVGDVAGHGVQAAVTMSAVRQSLRTAALERHDPHDVLARADAALSLEGRQGIVTAFFAYLDVPSRRCRYAVAGHPRPIVVDDEGRLTVLTGSGPPLGPVFDRALVQTQEIVLPRECRIALYTDGLLEYDRRLLRAQSRIERVLADRFFLIAENPAQEFIDAILDAPATDDIAVMIVSIEETRTDRITVTMTARPRAAAYLRERLRRFAEAHGVEGERLFRLLSAAGEAVANAVEHAYRDREAGPVTLEASASERTILVEVRDRGVWRESGSSAQRGRGRGIMELLAGYELLRSTEGTTVRLRL